MKIDKVIPCVCAPEVETEDSETGLPILILFFEDGEMMFSACCPKCGRGNRFNGRKNPADALDAWNNFQERLRNKIPEITMKKIKAENAGLWRF